MLVSFSEQQLTFLWKNISWIAGTHFAIPTDVALAWECCIQEKFLFFSCRITYVLSCCICACLQVRTLPGNVGQWQVQWRRNSSCPEQDLLLWSLHQWGKECKKLWVPFTVSWLLNISSLLNQLMWKFQKFCLWLISFSLHQYWRNRPYSLRPMYSTTQKVEASVLTLKTDKLVCEHYTLYRVDH